MITTNDYLIASHRGHYPGPESNCKIAGSALNYQSWCEPMSHCAVTLGDADNLASRTLS